MIDIVIIFLIDFVFYYTGEILRALFTLGRHKIDFSIKRKEKGKLVNDKSTVIGFLFWIMTVIAIAGTAYIW